MTAAPNREPDHAARYGGDMSIPQPEPMELHQRWEPEELKAHSSVQRGIIGELLEERYRLGLAPYVVSESRMEGFVRGEHKAWESLPCGQQAWVLQTVNGS